MPATPAAVPAAMTWTIAVARAVTIAATISWRTEATAEPITDQADLLDVRSDVGVSSEPDRHGRRCTTRYCCASKGDEPDKSNLQLHSVFLRFNAPAVSPKRSNVNGA